MIPEVKKIFISVAEKVGKNRFSRQINSGENVPKSLRNLPVREQLDIMCQALFMRYLMERRTFEERGLPFLLIKSADSNQNNQPDALVRIMLPNNKLSEPILVDRSAIESRPVGTLGHNRQWYIRVKVAPVEAEFDDKTLVGIPSNMQKKLAEETNSPNVGTVRPVRIKSLLLINQKT